MKKRLLPNVSNIQKKEKRKGASLTPPSAQRKQNKTGLPDQLKSGVESLSGMDMSNVKVHYNSSQPAQLNAQAYAQGDQIHIAPGQEKHLPHEAWHVVQQKQGRVKPTKQLKEKTNINDDTALENEADRMGARSLTAQYKPVKNNTTVQLDDSAFQNVAYHLESTHLPFQKAEDESVEMQVIQHFLVHEAQDAKEGQMAKDQFLDQLKSWLTQLAGVELAKIHQTTRNCPYLAYWISYYKKLPAATVERALRLYMSEELNTTNAHEVLSLVSLKVLTSLRAQLARSPLYPVTKANPGVLSAPHGVSPNLVPPKVIPAHSEVAQLGNSETEHDVDLKKSEEPVSKAPAEQSLDDKPGLWMASGQLEDLRAKMGKQVDLWGPLAKELVEYAAKNEDKLTDDYLVLGKLTVPYDRDFNTGYFAPGTTDVGRPLRRKVGQFLMSFLEANGQLDYMRSKKWFQQKTWKAVIEVNFYPDREFKEDYQYLKVHKDTDSKNLFVNLIFNNPADMPATEWTYDNKEADPERHAHLQNWLPQEEYDQILAAKKKIGKLAPETPGRKRWEGGTVKPYSYVSWIDELAWHSTPSMESRPEFTKNDVHEWLENEGDGHARYFLYEAMLLVAKKPKSIFEGTNWLKDLGTWSDKANELRADKAGADYNRLLTEIGNINWAEYKKSGYAGGVEVAKDGAPPDHREVPTKVGGRPRANSDPAVQKENQEALQAMKEHHAANAAAATPAAVSPAVAQQPANELPKRSFIRTWVMLVKN